MSQDRFAPAKVNLFLHVGPLGDDGYHPICSLMTFADVGDVVRLSPAHQASFDVHGPYGDGLAREAGANLVVKARDAVLAGFQPPLPAFRLTLEKRLPVAAGLGGGSADAAATLALLSQAFDLAPEDIAPIAVRLGSDVSACVASVPVLARGRGDELDYPPVFPDVDAVLVNPNQPCSTGRVYGAFDQLRTGREADEPEWPDLIETPQALASFLAGCRNDLETPAISLQPAIAQVLAALRERPETLLARMSGSGATCFALCASQSDSHDLALAIASFHPDWWVQRCVLAGFRP